MAAKETKPETEVKQPAPQGQNERPGTMFDPETIRKFLEQIKKDEP